MLTPAFSLCSLRMATMRRSTSALKTASLASFERCRWISPQKVKFHHRFEDFDSTSSKQTSTLRAIFTGVYRSTRMCKAHLVWPTHTIHNLLQVNIYYVTIVNLFSFHIGNMSQEKCHEKVGSRTKKLKSSERLASLSWSTWYIAPQVFVQLLENGLNPPSPQQASCYLRRSKHVSHSALFQASGR